MAQRARYDLAKIEHDMAAKGMDRKELGVRTGFSQTTLSRFFAGTQTVRVGKAVSKALGHGPAYYLIGAGSVAA